MPFVIPFFIPHQGCPQQCLFCNQHSIIGEKGTSEGVAAQVAGTIREWLARPRSGSGPVQMAFYGGSFTCLPMTRQEEMLAAVRPFLQSGQVDCIRLSTRPDCVDRESCSFLMDRGVRVVELGVQSLDDRVLRASLRGHDADDTRRAAILLREAGLMVGMQLLPGLPLETTGSFLRTVREVATLAPSFVRLYPVLIVEHAGLAEMYRLGEYQPLSMNRAIALSCLAKNIFEKAKIRVVRMGLQPSASLERELVAGPYHPAFGELVENRIWFKRMRPLLAACPPGKRVFMQVSSRDLSAVLGMKRANMRRFAQLGLADRLVIKTDKEMRRGTWKYAVS